jgi:hypothetical protein
MLLEQREAIADEQGDLPGDLRVVRNLGDVIRNGSCEQPEEFNPKCGFNAFKITRECRAVFTSEQATTQGWASSAHLATNLSIVDHC